MSDDDSLEQSKREAFGDKATLARTKIVGSRISATTRISLSLFDDPDRINNMQAPWAENSAMIDRLFKPAFERSLQCPDPNGLKCCQARAEQSCFPKWQEREDIEWYAREIYRYLNLIDNRLQKFTPATAALVADEAFELGCLFTEALIKFRWEEHAERGAKTLEGAKLGGDMRRGANPRRKTRAETAAECAALIRQGGSKMQVYRQIAKQQGVSAQTIRKDCQWVK